MKENYVGFNTQFGINTRSCLKEVNPDQKKKKFFFLLPGMSEFCSKCDTNKKITRLVEILGSKNKLV